MLPISEITTIMLPIDHRDTLLEPWLRRDASGVLDPVSHYYMHPTSLYGDLSGGRLIPISKDTSR